MRGLAAKALFFTLAQIGSAGPGRAQVVAIPRIVVSAPPFREYEPAVVRYTSRDVAGAIAGSLTRRAAQPVLLLTGISNADRTICVIIERSNGAYRATFDIRNPQRGGTIELVLPSRFIARLRAQAGEMAVRAQASSRATCAAGDPFLVASWARPFAVPVALLVNSQDSDYVGVSVNGRPASECSSLRDELGNQRMSVATFDRVCRLPAAGRCGGAQSLRIVRRQGPTYLAPLQLTLRNPCVAG